MEYKKNTYLTIAQEKIMLMKGEKEFFPVAKQNTMRLHSQRPA
jgi:hypothetical protein